MIGGNVTQVGEQGCNVTRNAWVAAGLPQTVSATSVDRQCGSSQQAVHFAAQGVMCGAYDIAIACGVESMTRAPMASNASGGIGPFSPDFMAACDGQLMTQFEVAQILADNEGITRDEMDAFAAESHRRAQAAWDSGHFDGESRGGAAQGRGGQRHRRDAVDATKASVPRPPSRRWPRSAPPPSGTRPIAPDITAGNASQMSDGAAAMLIADAATAERLGLAGASAVRALRGRRRGRRARAVGPEPGHPPAARTHRHDRSTSSTAIECNEAFAAVALRWAREFLPDGDWSRYNRRGGAIAIGHPLGASGVRIMTTLLGDLEATGGRYGFQTMCEGGGMANATVIERQ